MRTDPAHVTSDDRLAAHFPHNIDAEQALLGALLINNAFVYEQIEDVALAPSDFFDPLHAKLFDAAVARIKAGHLASPITMKPMFDGYEPITPDLPVWKYLGLLITNDAAMPHAAKGLAIEVKALAARRGLVTLGEQLITAARFDAESDPKSLIEGAERQLASLAEPERAHGEMTFAQALDAAFGEIHAAYQAGGVFQGTKTGYIDLDAKIGGFGDTDLVVLAGRPAMGKTALAVNVAFNAARADRALPSGEIVPQHVHFFTQEMSNAQLAMRILSERTTIAGDRLRKGDIDEHHVKKLMEQIADLKSSVRMTLDETGGLSVSQIASKARRVKRKHGTRLIIIDYIQLMRSSRRSDNRVQEITEITTGLKALAKELGVPILALSQLSRKVEERADKRPQLSDLRESGSIEQDADSVLFVYRDDYYLHREEPDKQDALKYADWEQKKNSVDGKAEVIVAKNRHGPVGIVRLAFDAKLTRFANLARGE